MDIKQPRRQLSIGNLLRGLGSGAKDPSSGGAAAVQSKRGALSTSGYDDGDRETNFRQDFVMSELERVKESYTVARDLKVVAVTWNLAGTQAPDNFDISQLINLEENADIYVIGFQEIVPLTPGSVLLVEDPAVIARWEKLIHKELNKKTESGADKSILGSKSNLSYYSVASRQMVGVHVSVWTRASMYTAIKCVETVTVGCGVLGIFGNKGGVFVRMRVYDTNLCIVCSHLSSGESPGVESKRNSEYHEILKRCNFSTPKAGLLHQPMPANVLDHDIILWVGDLNYRINLEGHEIHSLLEKNNLEAILEADQLNIERKAGRAFQGWKEGQVAFPPTYKYVVGSDRYSGDGRGHEGEKVRKPAWCDRILWNGSGCQLLMYNTVDVRISDHRPVIAAFIVQAREIEPVKLEEVNKEIRRKLDNLEMATQPHCVLENSIIDLGELSYGRVAIGSVVIRNVSTVLAKFNIVDVEENLGLPSANTLGGLSANKPLTVDVSNKGTKHKNGRAENAQEAQREKESEDDPRIFTPSWIKIHPRKGIIRPDNTVELSFSIVLDGSSAAANALVSQYKGKIDEIIVCRIEPYKDFFISVQAKYRGSFFSVSIPNLLAMPCCVREFMESGEPLRPSKCKSIPSELVAMTKAILKTDLNFLEKEFGSMLANIEQSSRSGAREGYLIMISLPSNEVDDIRICLDEGSPVDDFNPLGILSTICAWLSSLPTPLLTQRIAEICSVAPPRLELTSDSNFAQSRDHALYEMLANTLPRDNLLTYTHIISFLRILLESMTDSRTVGNILANLLCDPMFQSVNETNQVRQVHLDLLNMYLNLDIPDERLMLPFESIDPLSKEFASPDSEDKEPPSEDTFFDSMPDLEQSSSDTSGVQELLEMGFKTEAPQDLMLMDDVEP